MEGGDKIRAERALDILESVEEIRKIEQTTAVSKARATSENDQIQRDINKLTEQKKKEHSQHELKMKQEENATAIEKLKIQGQEQIELQRIEKERSIDRKKLENDTDLSQIKVTKLIQDVKTGEAEHNLRMSAAVGAKQERILAAQTEHEAGTIRLQLSEEQQQSAIKIRGDELRQNLERSGGDLDYQLKREVLKVAAETSRDVATALSAALNEAHINLLGDPSAAAESVKEYAKAFGLGTRAKELLALLDDVRVHETIRGVMQAIRPPGSTESKPMSNREDRGTCSGRADGSADNAFEP